MVSKLVLLVEDDLEDEALIRLAFRESGLTPEFVVARNGVQALDYLFGTGAYEGRNILDLPQVVILDINLPKIHGLEVLLQIRASSHTELLPVIMLTSSGQEEDMVDSYKFGANAYVRKPVDFDKFTDIIKHLGHFWLSVNESSSV